jgi:chemotaxis signal transduction protein
VTLAPPRLLVDPADEARLAAQARALAAGREHGAGGAEAPGQDASRGGLEVVTFTLGGRRCAIEASAVVRAVARLGPTTDVPLAGGGARPVAWLDEQPVAVTDLAVAAGLPARPAAALAVAPAILVATPGGAAALAVEGPLELAEDDLAQAAGPALAGLPGLGLAGQLAGGAVLVSATWAQACAAGARSP